MLTKGVITVIQTETSLRDKHIDLRSVEYVSHFRSRRPSRRDLVDKEDVKVHTS